MAHSLLMEPLADRRAQADRRTSKDRRHVVVRVPVEQRSGSDRRTGGERRAPQSLSEQIRDALELLTNAAEAGTLDDAGLRDLDAAVFRLRFVLDRFERTKQPAALGNLRTTRCVALGDR